IAAFESARTKLLQQRAFRQASVAAAEEARALADRGDPTTAWQRGLATEQAIAAGRSVASDAGHPARPTREGPTGRPRTGSAGRAAAHEASRAAPLLVADRNKPQMLALAPTRTIAGHVTPARARDVHVRFDLSPDTTWSAATAVTPDGGYRLDGVPAGGTLLAT